MGKRGRQLSDAAFGLTLSGVLALAAGGGAWAQSASSTLSGFSKGAGGYEGPVNVSTRDANGNMTIVNGVMEAPAGSIFANLSGVASSSAGAGSTASSSAGGSASATAIGNNLNVVVSGEYNTVIVNSSQTNTGAVSASTVLNGKVNLDGGQ